MSGQIIGVLAQSSGTIGGGEYVIFFFLAPLSILGALGMLFSRNAIHSALWLVVTMLCLGVFYMVQAGPFLGVVQIIVYTGAIMILFVFVLMLVGRDSSDSMIETLRGQRASAAWFGVGFAAFVGIIVWRTTHTTQFQGLSNADGFSANVPGLAKLIFTDYLLAFELTSALLITAVVGSMVLAHIERGKLPTQKERAMERFVSRNPQPLPGPGVFATSHSVATPALLPDGRIAPQSASTGVEMLPLSKGHLVGAPEQTKSRADDKALIIDEGEHR